MRGRVVGISLLLAVAGIGGWFWWSRGRTEVPKYRTEAVVRGDVEVLISSTGTLEATETVEVGSQVSGTLATVRADFNDRVKQGQVLATLDTEALDSSVIEAEASVERAAAQLAQAQADLARNRALFDAGLLSASVFEPTATAVRTAEAGLRSAQAGLERARKARRNAVILAPADGVVLERSVDPGQTVAASFTAPKLFVLARDLSTMRILADVDEGDIGQIRDGQEVRFTVAAHPGVSHRGRVEEIRLQPRTVQNVVTYTVVVSAPNPDGTLLPGMTATVDFVVDGVKDALTVPSAALRFKPDETAARAAFERRRRERQGAAGGSEAPGATASERRGPGGGDGSGDGAERRDGSGGRRARGDAGSPEGGPPPGVKMVWRLDAQGKLAPQPVRVGLSDGKFTAIEPLHGTLEPGDLVIVGVQANAGDAAATPARPGTGSGPGGGRRMPMPPMF